MPTLHYYHVVENASEVVVAGAGKGAVIAQDDRGHAWGFDEESMVG